MNVVEWYVGFWRPARPIDVIRGKAVLWEIFTHVEAWGYTEDRTWFFFDPTAVGSTVVISHHYDAVSDLLALRFAACQQILRLPHPGRRIGLPLHPTMNCAAQVGHLLGIRAYTPGWLRRRLLACGAEVIHDDATAAGRPGGQAPSGNRAAAG